MRNLFENNDPQVTPEEAMELGDKLVSVLPRLPERQEYSLVTLSDGRIAVIAQEETFPRRGDEPKTMREKLERRYHSQ